jgi:hypothetical protein
MNRAALPSEPQYDGLRFFYLAPNVVPRSLHSAFWREHDFTLTLTCVTLTAFVTATNTSNRAMRLRSHRS